jgi:hypothetical protein
LARAQALLGQVDLAKKNADIALTFAEKVFVKDSKEMLVNDVKSIIV